MAFGCRLPAFGQNQSQNLTGIARMLRPRIGEDAERRSLNQTHSSSTQLWTAARVNSLPFFVFMFFPVAFPRDPRAKHPRNPR
jgi:hypothetical protein